MKKNKQEKGFVILASTIIISALVVLIIIGVFVVSAGEIEKASMNKESQEVFYLASFCSEKALNEIRKDLSYSGETLGNCVIIVDNQIIKIEVEKEDVFKRIQINFSVNDKITIDNWQQVISF